MDRGLNVVECRDVSYSVGGNRILDKLSFTVRAGEIVVLLGRSGSGKMPGPGDPSIAPAPPGLK